jgi:hypothetical protein
MLLAVPHDDAPTLKVEVAALDKAKALERVNSTQWQRLRPLSRDVREVPGLVERIFTNRGPTDGARPVRIRTHVPELAELHGYAEDGTLFLKRPQEVALHRHFNDFVVDEGISGRYLTEVASAARQTTGDAVYTAQPALSVDAIRGMRAATYTAVGDYTAAATELRAAAAGGNLHAAAESYTRQLPRDLLANLREGSPVPAAAWFTRGNSPRQDADLQLVWALSELRQQRPHDAADILRTAIDKTPPSDTFAMAAEKALSSVPFKAVHDYTRARLGHIAGLAPEVASRVELQPTGFLLHTGLQKEALKGGKVLARAEQADLATIFRDQPPSAIYVEDTNLLNKLDWDGAPGPSLSKIAKAPDVVWERLSTDDLGGFRPSFLFDGDKRLVRRDIPTLAARRSAATGSVRPSRPHVYLVRNPNCDENCECPVTSQKPLHCVNE